ncbi:MAG TPA: tetratricopeptide repeat protein, partial [Candidatus Ozemobacteraceae bacterium]|nr:tetratricopeptide repeat protein [Candidatus Ozemobacteraceae bacterium]
AAGEIGTFIQDPESFSEALTKALTPEVHKDMEGLAGAAPPPPSRPPEESVLHKCIELFQQERYDDAIPILVKYRHWFPENQEALYHLAACHHRKGSVDEAIPLLEELLKLNQAHVQGGLLLGQIYFQRKDWPSLAVAYEKFRAHLPATDRKALAQVQGALGLAYFHQKKYPKALEMLKAAMAINARDLSSAYHLALTYIAMKDHGSATRILRALQSNLPPNSQVLKNVEDLLQKMEEEG